MTSAPASPDGGGGRTRGGGAAPAGSGRKRDATTSNAELSSPGWPLDTEQCHKSGHTAAVGVCPNDHVRLYDDIVAAQLRHLKHIFSVPNRPIF